MSKIFVSIATYNEQENIERLVRRIFSLNIKDLFIVVVDDNSPDGTADIVSSLEQQFAQLHLIKRSGKLGYGSAHIAAFNYGLDKGADILISMDADFSHDPADIPQLVQAIQAGGDVAVASRKVSGGKVIGWNLWRKFMSLAAMLYAQAILNIKTRDITNGFRAYSRQVFDQVKLGSIKSSGYSFLEEFIYKIEKAGLTIMEIPSTFTNRTEGASKLNKKEIVNFFLTILKIRLTSIKDFRLNLLNITFILLGLSFFIGLWHALPMLKVVGDEMYFVGGVLRAMENHSLLPLANDVPYGTLTYFLSYFSIAGYLIILLPFFEFSLANLKSYLIIHPEIVYIIPRILSAFLAIGYLALFNKILKKQFEDIRPRLFLIILLFTNMLTVLILHTGKMWVLSMLLVLISFYYLHQALKSNKANKHSKLNKSIFLSILFAFLALANLPFFAFALINIPILFIFFFKDKPIRRKVIHSTLISLIIFTILISLNFSATRTLIINQLTNYNPILDSSVLNTNLTIPASLWLNLQKILVFFPLFLLTLLIVVKNKIKDKPLFLISLVYLLAYYLSMSILATWPTGLDEYIRYLFPIGFFLILIIASFNLYFKKYYHLITLISLVYFIPTLYFLSVPTTLNQARHWVVDNLNQPDSVIVNQIAHLDLPKNKESYQLLADYYCASKCQNIIDQNLNQSYQYLIFDKYVKPDIPIPQTDSLYYIQYESGTNPNLELVASFTNATHKGFTLDGRMANYFDWDFFHLKNFGPDIYIYQ